ncbi:unnamed protein product [Gordionus sp. m RMFG-2023]
MSKYCEEIFGDLLLRAPLDNYPLSPGVLLPSPTLLKRKIIIKNKRLKVDIEKKQLELLKQGKAEAIETEYAIADEEDAINIKNAHEEAHPEFNKDILTSLSADVPFDPTPSVAPPRLPASTPAPTRVKKEKDSENVKPGINNFSITSSNTGNASLNNSMNSSTIQDPAILALENLSNSTGSSKKGSTKFKKGMITSDEEAALMSTYHYTGATTNIHPLLSVLVNYMQPVKFPGFQLAEERNLHFNMSSFNETAGLSIIKNSVIEFVNYNKRQISRIYPKGGRVDSSNFLPQIFWNAGCQMVALNFQTADLAMQLNQGKFEYNNNTGYLLKPDFLRRPDRQFDPFSETPVDGVIAAHSSVQIISGQFLSDKKIGTYVEVDMYGLPTDTIRKEFRTRLVPSNGLNPVYNEEPFVFRKVVLPDLAVIRIGVYDENNRLLGQRVLPLDGLQTGYRHISLRTDANFPMSLPTIFCCIVLKTYVPDGLGNFVDALSAPMQFMPETEKRLKQLEQMGIDSGDLNAEDQDTPSNLSSSYLSTGLGNLLTSANSSGKSLSSLALGAYKTSTPTTSMVGKGIGARKDQPANEINIGDGHASSAALFGPITREILKGEKEFSKLLKRQQKELEILRKKQGKERSLFTKSSSQIQSLSPDFGDENASSISPANANDYVDAHHRDKILASPSSMPSGLAASSFSNVSNLTSSNIKTYNGIANGSIHPESTFFKKKMSDLKCVVGVQSKSKYDDPKIYVLDENSKEKLKRVLIEQSREWNELLKRQNAESVVLEQAHVTQQCTCLRTLIEQLQIEQIKNQEIKQAREIKNMKSSQARASMEAIKAVQSDKRIKNKAERERRVRELNSNNTKKFIDERKRIAMKHSKEMDSMKKVHQEEIEALEKENEKMQKAQQLIAEEVHYTQTPESVI